MIIKRNFHPLRVWSYIWREVSYSLLLAIIIYFIYLQWDQGSQLAIPFTPVGVLGSALAIFVAFRNQSAYGRWWEARQLWGGIVNSSRVLARLIITFADSHSHQPNYDINRSTSFKKDMIYRQIAWVHALRLHLRKQKDWEILKSLLHENEFYDIIQRQNKPNYLQTIMGRHIYAAMADGTLGGFDSFQIEGQLLALANYQGACERIKNTPLPRQYDFFTRLFVWTFATVLPFGLLSLFTVTPNLAWLIIPLTVLIAGMFTIMDKTGSANEDPFENLVTDVPLTALCNTIERDLKEQLNEPLPPKLEPQNGYLW
ncbi:MAG: bestrophin family protein [Saprospiraceae bacterium]